MSPEVNDVDHAVAIFLRRPHGHIALVSPEDAPLLTHAWDLDPHTGYVISRIDGKRAYLHRLVMGDPPGEVDHKNGDKTDCRRSNLRVGTRSQNKQNLRAYKGTRYRGVSRNERRGKWEASVRLNGKRVFFQRFDTEDEAGAAASEARRKHMPWSAENTEMPAPILTDEVYAA